MSNIKAQLEQRFADIAQTGNLFKCVILLGTNMYSQYYPNIERIDTIKKNNSLLFNERILNSSHLEYHLSRVSCERDIYEIFSEACRAEKIDNNLCTQIFDKDTINDLYQKQLPRVKKDTRDEFSKIFYKFKNDLIKKEQEQQKLEDVANLAKHFK